MTRIITGVVGVLIMIPVCFFSHTVVWPLFLSLFAFVAIDELLRCVKMNEEKAFAFPTRVLSILPLATWLVSVRFHLIDPFRFILILIMLYLLTEQIN